MITLPNKDAQVDIDELNDELDELLQESAKESSCSINPLLVGTWFMVKALNHTYICKEQPERVGSSAWRIKCLNPSGWLALDEDGQQFGKLPYSDLSREEFNKLDLPEVTEENSPLEIEIMKSGNVYYYES
jgi:hypothetical protein